MERPPFKHIHAAVMLHLEHDEKLLQLLMYKLQQCCILKYICIYFLLCIFVMYECDFQVLYNVCYLSLASQ